MNSGLISLFDLKIHPKMVGVGCGCMVRHYFEVAFFHCLLMSQTTRSHQKASQDQVNVLVMDARSRCVCVTTLSVWTLWP